MIYDQIDGFPKIVYIASCQVEECVGDVGAAIDIESAVSLVLVAVVHGTLALHVRHVYVALVPETHRGPQTEPEGGAAGPGGEGGCWLRAPQGDLSAGGAQGEVAVEHQTQPGGQES